VTRVCDPRRHLPHAHSAQARDETRITQDDTERRRDTERNAAVVSRVGWRMGKKKSGHRPKRRRAESGAAGGGRSCSRCASPVSAVHHELLRESRRTTFSLQRCAPICKHDGDHPSASARLVRIAPVSLAHTSPYVTEQTNRPHGIRRARITAPLSPQCLHTASNQPRIMPDRGRAGAPVTPSPLRLDPLAHLE